MEGAVYLFRGRGRPQLGLVPRALAGFFLAPFQLAAAEVPGLPVRLAARLIEFLAETVLVNFQLGQAALQAAIVVSQLVHLIPQACQLALAQPTAAAVSDRRKHGKPQKTLFRMRFIPRCFIEVHLHPRSQVKRLTRPKFPPDRDQPRLSQNRTMLLSEKRKLSER
jgi:hypothetical protein